MLFWAIGIFILAAIFGFIVLTFILRNQSTPKASVFMHGSLAVIALLIVIYYFFINSGNGPVLSLVLFIIAALGGLTLFTIDMSKKPIPKWLAIVHPLIAVTGLLALVVFALNNI